MVGLGGPSAPPPGVPDAGSHAFRYVHGTGVSAIPELGTWSKAHAVSPDGNLTLVAGDSAFLPTGEMYLYNATTLVTTPLGSPNTPWRPTNPTPGMTPDGSVVAVSESRG
jgi:hypothetical protein